MKPEVFLNTPFRALQRYRDLAYLASALVLRVFGVLASLKFDGLVMPILYLLGKYKRMRKRLFAADHAFKITSFGKWLKNHEFLSTSIVFLALILLFFSPTLVQGKLPLSTSYLYQMSPWASYSQQFKPDMVSNNVLSDVYDSGIPMMNFFYTEIHHGEYPLWVPYVNSGIPYGLLLPSAIFTIHFLAIILAGTKWGTILYMSLKIYIAGISTYYYLRYRQFARFSALFGSLTLMFSAYIIVNGMEEVADSVVYAPVILYFAERFIREKQPWLFYGLIISVAVTFASGFPSVTMYTLITVTIYLAYRNLVEIRDQAFSHRIKNLFYIASAFLIGILLLSFTLLPTYEFFKDVNIGYRVGRGAITLNWIAVGRLINPNTCGNPVESAWVCKGNYNTSALYTGLLPLMLVPFSLANKKHRTTSLFFFGVAVLILIIVFGVGSANEIVGNLPLFNFNPNTRMIALLPLCAAFVAAIGADQLTKTNNRMGYLSIIFFALLIGWCIYFFDNFPLASAVDKLTREYFLNQRFFTVMLLLCYSLIIVLLLAIKERTFITGIRVLLLAINFVELSLFFGDYQGASYPETFYPETPAITFLSSKLPNYERIAIIGRHFVPNMPLYYSINSLTGHAFADVAFKSDLDLINPGIYANGTTQPLFSPSLINLTSPLLDAYRVRYVVTSPSEAPIWWISMADQEEYNQIYALNKLNSFSQSMTIVRNGYAGIFEIKISTSGTKTIPANVKISSGNNPLTEFDGQLAQQDNGFYSINLPNLLLKQGQHITFEITPDKNLLPANSALYAVNFDIYNGGSMILDGKETGGDLAFALLQYDSTIAQKYKLVHTGDLNIFENMDLGNELPVVNKFVYSNRASCASKLNQINPASEAVVDDQGLMNLVKNSPDSSSSSAQIREYTANSVLIDASTYQASMVILSDTYYPGWQATIDGKQTKIYRVDCDMRGIVVTPGKHVIEMDYDPLSFKIGLGISMFTFVGLALASVVIAWRRP